jgi:hypothetical protein
MFVRLASGLSAEQGDTTASLYCALIAMHTPADTPHGVYRCRLSNERGTCALYSKIRLPHKYEPRCLVSEQYEHWNAEWLDLSQPVLETSSSFSVEIIGIVEVVEVEMKVSISCQHGFWQSV